MDKSLREAVSRGEPLWPMELYHMQGSERPVEVGYHWHREAEILYIRQSGLWVLAGGELCAATDDAWKDFDLPLDEDTVNLGVLKQLSLEALLSSRPDFVLASICLGVIPLTVEELIRALAQGPGAGWESSIVWYARLPRTLASVFAGAALASSGAVLQNVLANKLASPNGIGVNAGAGLGVTVCVAAGGEPQRSCSKASAVKMW